MLITCCRAVTAAIAATAALAASGTAYASVSQPNAQATPNVRVGSPTQEEGRILINERSYLAHKDGCITVMSGLGATSFNIFNDSSKTVLVFDGAVCDNGAPIATIGPKSTADGVRPHTTATVFAPGAPIVTDVLVASFLVK
ncbi:hypothetical protein ACWC2T_40745 [Streptomyces sp. NPDC001393]